MSNVPVIFVFKTDWWVCFIQELDESSVAHVSPTIRTLSNTSTANVFTGQFIYRKSHFLEVCICWQILADNHEICNSKGPTGFTCCDTWGCSDTSHKNLCTIFKTKTGQGTVQVQTSNALKLGLFVCWKYRYAERELNCLKECCFFFPLHFLWQTILWISGCDQNYNKS